jgi:hypothetical protein
LLEWLAHCDIVVCRFSIIDINNVLSFFDMEARTINATGVTVQGEHGSFEKKDVWVRDCCIENRFPWHELPVERFCRARRVYCFAVISLFRFAVDDVG